MSEAWARPSLKPLLAIAPAGPRGGPAGTRSWRPGGQYLRYVLDGIPPDDDVEEFAPTIDGQMFTFHIDNGAKKADDLRGVGHEEAGEIVKGRPIQPHGQDRDVRALL